jgi:hypothetical protein
MASSQGMKSSERIKHDIRTFFVFFCLARGNDAFHQHNGRSIWAFGYARNGHVPSKHQLTYAARGARFNRSRLGGIGLYHWQRHFASRQALQSSGRTICYGYLAERGWVREMVAVIRGTDGFVEWIEDAEFVPIPYSPQIGLSAGLGAMSVEQGFWTLYASMQLISPIGTPLGVLAPSIATAVGPAGMVTVIGHSLGSALATYLTLDLARGGLAGRVSACLFASPHTGNQAFVELFDQTIVDYRLFNYILDIVPRVCWGRLLSASAQDGDPARNRRSEHPCRQRLQSPCHLLLRDAGLRGDMQATTPVPAGEEGSAACILGPETGNPSLGQTARRRSCRRYSCMTFIG